MRASATASAATRNASVAVNFPSQIALRSTGARTSPSSTRCSRSGTNAAREPEERGEEDRDPEQPDRLALGAAARQREPERDSVATTKRSIAGSVSRARSSSSKSLRASAATSRAYVTARALRTPAAEPLAVVRRDEERGAAEPLRQLAVESSRTLVVEAGERLVEQQQRRLVQERPAEREPLQHAARVRPGALVASLPEPEPLEQHPDPFAGLGHAVEARRRARGSRSRSARGTRAARARGSRAPARSASTLNLPPVGAASPATRRSSVVLPEPFGPVTTTNSPRRTSRSSPRRTRFAPKRRSRPRAWTRDHVCTWVVGSSDNRRTACSSAGPQHGEAVATAPVEPGRFTISVSPERPRRRARATRAASSRASRRGSPRRCRAPRVR